MGDEVVRLKSELAQARKAQAEAEMDAEEADK